ncbi:alpha/beta hydrolase [Lacimicrobium alkaliphilum]|uniref:DUF1023 domain-containing protein n=1 Tax=Lacimicrobium alkaliphilum TaxID=1526571 RepID=A0ABQ1RAI4_9ALTE|nr:alpha/beta hydrolase [Lacimicrobium alkaliphilum]GGD59824.1 hypothetical protein GCM10011357_13860 [Lacimicrobium alkaliphilum]
MRRLFPVILTALFFSTGPSGEIYEAFPDNVSPDDKYLFYSHGYIVEGDNPRPVETRFGWGVYDFPAIKTALASEDYHLIAYHRPENTDPFDYAQELNLQVRQLVDAGVPAAHITIMGFSRGAFITGVASGKLADLNINTVILAGCGGLGSAKYSDIRVYGHVLSVYEKSDRAGSCKKLRENSTQLTSFTEIEINTGLDHGAFYQPLTDWLGPTRQWINTKMNIQ